MDGDNPSADEMQSIYYNTINDPEFNEFKEFTKTQIESDFGDDLRIIPDLGSSRTDKQEDQEENYGIHSEAARFKFIEEQHKLVTLRLNRPDQYSGKNKKIEMNKSNSSLSEYSSDSGGRDLLLMKFKVGRPKINEVQDCTRCLKEYLKTTKKKAKEIHTGKGGKRKLAKFLKMMSVIFSRN